MLSQQRRGHRVACETSNRSADSAVCTSGLFIGRIVTRDNPSWIKVSHIPSYKIDTWKQRHMHYRGQDTIPRTSRRIYEVISANGRGHGIVET